MPCNEMLTTRYQCMKGFVASKGRLRTSISSTHFGLTHQNANTQKKIVSIDLCQGHASCNLDLKSYLGSVPEFYFCEFVCGQVPTNFEETRVSHVQQATYCRIILIRQIMDNF